MPELTKPAVSSSMTTNSSNQSQLITAAEAAKSLMVRVPTIHVYIRKGIIPAFKFGDTVRIPRDEFYQWLETTRVVPQP